MFVYGFYNPEEISATEHFINFHKYPFRAV